jgi:hypothetical protein
MLIKSGKVSSDDILEINDKFYELDKNRNENIDVDEIFDKKTLKRKDGSFNMNCDDTMAKDENIININNDFDLKSLVDGNFRGKVQFDVENDDHFDDDSHNITKYE